MNDDSFFSMNRLLEFSMGLAMAQQMSQMMNQTISQMRIPGADKPMTGPVQQQIFISIDNKPIGPLCEHELLQLASDDKICKTTLAWMPGMTAWQPIEQVPQLFKILVLANSQTPLEQ